jgi:hypothetical protein
MTSTPVKPDAGKEMSKEFTGISTIKPTRPGPGPKEQVAVPGLERMYETYREAQESSEEEEELPEGARHPR